MRKGAGEEADERALLAGYWFDESRAQHFFDFVKEYGTLTEGAFAGQPFELQTWQRLDCGRVFGWLGESPEWGQPVRRFRYWYEELPKKNGKTPLAAVVANYLFFGDSAGRQINQHTVATTKKQAERLNTHAINQIRNSRELNAAADIKKLEGFQCITYGRNVWNVLAADPASADGVNGHIIADELHRWVGNEFFNTLRWALASQPEGLFAGFTTAGNSMESVCWSLHEKTRAIDVGRQVDHQFYGRIYGAEPTDDPHDEKTWFKANQSLGSTRAHPLKLSTFRADYEAAKVDPTQWDTWLRLRLGLWSTGVDSWIAEIGGIAKWDAGETARKAAKRTRIDCYEPFTLETLKGRRCFAALDGATHHDTTSLVFAFPDGAVDELIRVLPFFWLPRAEAAKQQSRVPYQAWSESGLITLTEGDAVDFEQVYTEAVALIEVFEVEALYFDPMFQAEWLTQKISAHTGIERKEFPQTIMEFSPPMKAAERLIILKKLRHNGHAVLTWQMGHVHAKTDVNNNKRPIKRKRGCYKTVDGVTAMIMTLAGAAAMEFEYEDNGDIEWV